MPKTRITIIDKLRRESGGMPKVLTNKLKKRVKKVKLRIKPATTPKGLFLPPVKEPVNTTGSIGKIQGERIVTIPAKNAKRINRNITVMLVEVVKNIKISDTLVNTKMKTEVFFDVETKKLFGDVAENDPALLGVSIVSVYSREIDENLQESVGRKILSEVEGKMQSFWENEFDKMWPVFQEADRIIGFNTIGFDIPALKPYTNFPFSKLPHFDIMAELKEVFGRRISLDAIARETLDREKTDSGLNAVYYWQKGDKESLVKLKKYCEADVLITRDVYDYVLKNNHLLFKDKWNTLRKVELDFSYPEEKSEIQTELF